MKPKHNRPREDSFSLCNLFGFLMEEGDGVITGGKMK